MRNIYVSILGIGDYIPCSYYFDKIHESQDEPIVRFIQETTIRELCKDWLASDTILILATEAAYKANWLDNGHQNHDGKMLEREGLRSRLSKLNIDTPYENIRIPNGQSEAEIWEIFQILFDQLQEEDSVIFDITHALRSIPLLVLVVLYYAKVLKNISLKGMYYGAFEILGTPSEVSQMPFEMRRAPIFNLSPFFDLLDWTLAIDRFMKTGDARSATALAKDKATSILRKSDKAEKAALDIKKVANLLNTFSKDLATCRGTRLARNSNELRVSISKNLEDESSITPAFMPLLKKVEKAMEGFQGNEIMDGIEAARWCHKHNFIQQSYTLLREIVVSYVVLSTGGNTQDIGQREYAAKALSASNIEQKKIRSGKVSNSTEDYSVATLLPNWTSIVKFYSEISDSRNDLNHAGYRRQPRKPEQFAGALPDLIRRLESMVSIS